MSGSKTQFIEEMDLMQARSSIRALSRGATTFLRALQDVELTVDNAEAASAVDQEIAAQQDNYTMRIFTVAVRLLRDRQGDPVSITLDAVAVARENSKEIGHLG